MTSLTSDPAADGTPAMLMPAQDADLAAVAALVNRAYRGTGAQRSWDDEKDLIAGARASVALLQGEIAAKPQGAFLLWRAGAALRGCVWVEPIGDGAWYLGTLAIDPDMQDAGLGRRLLDAAEHHIRAAGGRTVRMTVLERRTALIAWYVRRGYAAGGETEAFPYGDDRFGVPLRGDLRFVVMVKAL